jgi:glutathione S-transferase
MVLKLYGTVRSPWARLVAAVLLEKKVPFEFVFVDLSKREQKLPEYLSKNPFGQIPYIVSYPLDYSLARIPLNALFTLFFVRTWSGR